MKNIEDFIELIIKEKGYENKDPEVLAQIKSDLSDRFETRINAMIVSHLSEDQLPSFDKILDTDNEEEINKFLMAHIPNVEELMLREMQEFKSLYFN